MCWSHLSLTPGSRNILQNTQGSQRLEYMWELQNKTCDYRGDWKQWHLFWNEGILTSQFGIKPRDVQLPHWRWCEPLTCQVKAFLRIFCWKWWSVKALWRCALSICGSLIIHECPVGLGNLDLFGPGFLGLLKHFDVFLAREGCWQLWFITWVHQKLHVYNMSKADVQNQIFFIIHSQILLSSEWDGWTDRQMGGWMDGGGREGQMDGWIDGYPQHSTFNPQIPSGLYQTWKLASKINRTGAKNSVQSAYEHLEGRGHRCCLQARFGAGFVSLSLV